MKLYFSENIIDENLLDNYLKKISKYKIIISEEGIFKITDKIFKEYCEDKPIEEKYIEDFKFVLDKSEINYKEVYSIPLKHKSFDYEEIEFKKNNKSKISLVIKKTKEYKDYYFKVNNFMNTDNLEVKDYINLLKLK